MQDKIKPGFYPKEKLSNEAYHTSEGISKTGLVKLARSPAHYKAPPLPPTRALVVGSAFHTAVLEPEKFEQQYAILPADMKATTKAGIAWKAEQIKAGKEILTAAEGANLPGMSKAVREHPKAAALLTGGVVEMSAFWVDRDYGFTGKVRTDFINDNAIIIELKSCTDARPFQFSRDFIKYDYAIQDAWYRHGLTEAAEQELGRDIEHNHFVFIAVEKEPPYGIGTYKTPEVMLEAARDIINVLRAIYARCLESEKFPCYDTEIMEIETPKWWLNKQEGVGFYD